MATEPLHFVDANGLRFAYLEEGAGPLVLMLHGFPDTAHTWDFVRPQIAARGFRVVCPYMRGYRPSGIPDRDADQETLARDALALIGALGETSAIVVGHDWGAATGYSAAAIEPARVRKLITLTIPHPGTVRPTPAKVWGVRHFLAYKLRSAPRRFAADDFAALPAIYRRWSPTWNPPAEEFTAVRECFADAASLNAAFGYYRALSFRVPPYLKKTITVPTVAFGGADDPIVHRDDYERAARIFSGGYQVEEMPGGHFMHREHPEIFATRVLKHL